MTTPQQNETQLSHLLKQWQAPEAGPYFEQRVMRRAQKPPAPWVAAMEWFSFHPALVRVAAALPAVVLGAWLGYATAVSPSPSVGILARGNISGQYAQLVTGGVR